MWPMLIVALSVAAWTILSVLNNGVWSKLQDSKTEILASKLLIEHDCKVSGGCKGGYESDLKFSRSAKITDYYWTYTVSGYRESDGYLPILLDKTKNSYICVASWNGNSVTLLSKNISPSVCQSIPSEINQEAKKTDGLVNGALILYQKRV